jgi:hypothetical protein
MLEREHDLVDRRRLRFPKVDATLCSVLTCSMLTPTNHRFHGYGYEKEDIGYSVEGSRELQVTGYSGISTDALEEDPSEQSGGEPG